MKRAILLSLIGVLILLCVSAYVYFAPSHTATINIPFTPDAEPKIENIEILFVGDMFFDRYIRKVSETVGTDYIFSCIFPLLSRADIIVGNLEGPITKHPSVASGTTPEDPDHFRFTFPIQTALSLKQNNVSIVHLGNNHIGNFGREGIQETRTHLEQAGVQYFGGLSGDEPVYRRDVDGNPLSFVSYNQFGGSSVADVADTVRREVAVGRSVIVYTHWGDEYASTTQAMKDAARAFSDAGARAVIGSHPHVVLESEYIGSTLVYYSLGNFIFDQYWNDSVSRGLAVLIHVPSNQSTQVSVTEYPILLTKDGRVCESEALPRPL